jgi:DNA-binding NarL/FixJ family response regulator
MATCERCDKPLAGRQTRWCSENCRKRTCDERNRKACPNCGELLAARSGWSDVSHSNFQCRPCEDAQRARRWQQRLERVADMYRAGMPIREIAESLGYGPKSVPPEVVHARRQGLIGYRHKGYESKVAQ